MIAAAATIRGSVIVTECNQSRTLSEVCGCDLWLKFENLQFTSTSRSAVRSTGSSRCRRTSGARRDRDVGGQSRAGRRLSRHRLGIPATIVMPVGTPMVKIENTRRHGAKIVISGETLEEAGEFAREYGKAHEHDHDPPL